MTEPLDPPPTPNPTLERMAREAHELRLMERAADTMEQIFNHIACGGTLSGLCEIWQVRWYKIRNWIYDDDDRRRMLMEARAARKEWIEDQVLQGLLKTGKADVRKLFDKDGALKKPTELDDDTAAAVNSYEDDGKSKRVKFADKQRSLELLGKTNAMFTDKTEHSVDKTLEDLVAGSMEDRKPDGGQSSGE